MNEEYLSFLHYGHTSSYKGAVDKQFSGYDALQFSGGGGSIDLTINGKPYLLEGSWFWVTFDGGYFRYHPHDENSGWDHHFLAFRGPLSERWRELGLLTFEPQQVYHPQDWSARLHEIFDCIGRHEALEHARAVNLLEGLLLELAGQRRKSSVREPWVAHVRKSLAEADSQAPDYESLARECNMSLSSLRQKFRASTGVSLHRYHLKCRVDAACRLLAETNLSIKEIAARLGYNDIYFFSRQFRKISGMPPGLFRRNWGS